MEKMLDKKSRDFAKNMRDTMIYDKSKNEVQIGTNLYVDGYIKTAGNKRIIDVSTLPTEEGGHRIIFDASNFSGATALTFQEGATDKILNINTGSSYIIIDASLNNNTLLYGYHSFPLSNDNFLELEISKPIANGIIIINLSSVVLVYLDHEF